MLAAALETLLSGELPPKGTVLAPDVALCQDCPRQETRPEDLKISEFKRPHEILIDEELCLLAQGLACLGPATRSGCGAACISGNMPCTGCFGPVSRVRDHGAKIVASLASIAEPIDGEGVSRTFAGIPDPIGTFYRYGLPASLLRRRRVDGTNGNPSGAR